MLALDIVVEDLRWAEFDLEGLIVPVLRAGLTTLGYKPEMAEISILACDDARIAVLNGDFRAKPGATNVLSWPAEERGAPNPGENPLPVLPGQDGLLEMGDIAISYDTCAAEADAAGRSMADHVRHLVLHGLLHLLGYDHIHDADAALMEALEVKILGKLGVDNPYIGN